MKKIIRVILSITACLIMSACEVPGMPIDPTPPNGGIEQGGGAQDGGTEEQNPETPPSSGGGNVVTPIQPGGDYSGGGY